MKRVSLDLCEKITCLLKWRQVCDIDTQEAKAGRWRVRATSKLQRAILPQNCTGNAYTKARVYVILPMIEVLIKMKDFHRKKYGIMTYLVLESMWGSMMVSRTCILLQFKTKVMVHKSQGSHLHDLPFSISFQGQHVLPHTYAIHFQYHLNL